MTGRGRSRFQPPRERWSQRGTAWACVRAADHPPHNQATPLVKSRSSENPPAPGRSQARVYERCEDQASAVTGHLARDDRLAHEVEDRRAQPSRLALRRVLDVFRPKVGLLGWPVGGWPSHQGRDRGLLRYPWRSCRSPDWRRLPSIPPLPLPLRGEAVSYPVCRAPGPCARSMHRACPAGQPIRQGSQAETQPRARTKARHPPGPLGTPIPCGIARSATSRGTHAVRGKIVQNPGL